MTAKRRVLGLLIYRSIKASIAALSARLRGKSQEIIKAVLLQDKYPEGASGKVEPSTNDDDGNPKSSSDDDECLSGRAWPFEHEQAEPMV